MAIAVVNSQQTAGASANAAITYTAGSATTGNILVCALSETAATTNAGLAISDNIGGGWTINANKSTSPSSPTASQWFATKTAVGGESTLTWTPSTGGVGQGVCFFELSGASTTLGTNSPFITNDAGASISTITSGSVTTSNAGSIILGFVGIGAAGGSGTIGAWSGTTPLTNIGTAAARCFGGSWIPGSIQTGVTFTANWGTARNASLLIVEVTPAVATSGSNSQMMSMGLG